MANENKKAVEDNETGAVKATAPAEKNIKIIPLPLNHGFPTS